MSDPAIELRSVDKRFGPVTALSGVSLQVNQGEFLTLLGPSGCGKTTTLRLIAGFEQPTSGEILIAGRSVVGVPPERRDVNIVFQSDALFPHMTVAQNIGFGPRMSRARRSDIRRRTAEILTLLHLENLGPRKPRQLSADQRQRAGLARALVNHPIALLLDEPLGALDLKPRLAMQLELRKLNRSLGITFLSTTHDRDEALAMSDRIAVMSEGHIAQIGTAQEIYETPATRFVADFIGEANFLEGKVTGWIGGIVAVATPAGTIAVRCGAMLPTGTAVCVFVRPERVGVTAAGGAGSLQDNLIRGRLVDAVYAGPVMAYTVEAAGGIRITARAPLKGQALDPGSEVAVRWSTGECSVLV
ncbi:MAG: ABC transporter ATP-binding protein [Chloroflexota bacterium]